MAGSWRALLAQIAMGSAILGGCAAPSSRGSAAHAVEARKGSILVASTPAPASEVNGPVNELKLRFDPPARLDRVTLTGPDGMMPMMVTAVGEVPDYSVPLPGLGAGTYALTWRATAQGKTYNGSFQFSVK